MNDEEDKLPIFERIFEQWCSIMYKSRVRRAWYKTVMSPEWEAAILLAVYLVIKTTQTWNGHFLYRAHM